jgi:putative acetyltransferase
MEQLEAHAAECGVNLIRLETGVKQPEAVRLYRKLGYVERGPFGHYRADPLSVFMEKTLKA